MEIGAKRTHHCLHFSLECLLAIFQTFIVIIKYSCVIYTAHSAADLITLLSAHKRNLYSLALSRGQYLDLEKGCAPFALSLAWNQPKIIVFEWKALGVFPNIANLSSLQINDGFQFF